MNGLFNIETIIQLINFWILIPIAVLDKKDEIGLVKLDGILEIDNKIHINHINNKVYYLP